MKKIVCSLFLALCLFFGLESIEADELIKLECQTNCKDENSVNCNTMCDTLSNFFDECIENKDSSTCKTEAYNYHYEIKTESEMSDEIKNQCQLKCSKENGVNCVTMCSTLVDLYKECIRDSYTQNCEKQVYDKYYHVEKAPDLTWKDKVICGDIKIPYVFPSLVNTVLNIIKIVVPIIIIIMGSIDLVKAVMAQKEDEIKKGQQIFVKRLITGVIVFLVFVFVELIIGIVAPRTDANNKGMWNCVDCFVNGDCKTQ